MILISGSLSFAKLVMMSSAPTQSAGDARHASQDPLINLLIDRLSHTISTPNAIRSGFCIQQSYDDFQIFYLQNDASVVLFYNNTTMGLRLTRILEGWEGTINPRLASSGLVPVLQGVANNTPIVAFHSYVNLKNSIK